MLHSQRKPVLIAPKRLEPSPALETDLDVEMADDEPIVIVEPTDPDEDRLKAAEVEESNGAPLTLEEPETNKLSEESNGGTCAPYEASDKPTKTQVTGITTDPVLLNQILHALSAKPVKSTPIFSVPVVSSESSHQTLAPVSTTATANHIPQARLLVASSNVYTIQAQAPIQARAGAPQSIMLQSLNGIQTARIVASPLTVSQISPITSIDSSTTGAAVRDETGVSQPITNGPAQTANLQNLITTNPLLSAVLVNCATANLLTQLANSVSSSMLSLAQSIAVEKQQNMAGQISELTQMLSALTSLASTLSSSLPSLANLRTNSATPTNPILTSLISQINTSTATPMLSSVIPLASLKLVTGTDKPKTDSVPSTISTISLPAVSAYGTTMPNITISPLQSTPIPIVTAARTVATSRLPDHIGLSGVITAVPSSVSPSVIAVAATPPVTSATQSNSTTMASAIPLPVTTSTTTTTSTTNRIKRFRCTHLGCGRAFYSHFNLVEHIRTHTGERPFVCPVSGCKSRFKRRRDLTEHDSVHRAKRETDGGGPLLALLTEEQKEKDDSAVADLSTAAEDAGDDDENDKEEEEEDDEDDDDDDEDEDDDDDDDEDDDDDDEDDEEDEEGEGSKQDGSKSDGGTSTGQKLTQGECQVSPRNAESEKAPSRKRKRHFCPFPNCNRSYARRHRLNQHMCQHTGIGPYYCDQPSCSVKYFCASDLDRHKLVHLVPTSGDPLKRHLCPYPGCGKAYSKLNKLREHVRSHTGERPYVCEHPGCNASFIRLYGLKRHQLTHSTLPMKNDERRYPTILPVSTARPTETAVIVAPAGAILPQSAIVSFTTVPAPFAGAVAPTSSSPSVSAVVSPSQLFTKPEPTSPPPAPSTPVVPSTESDTPNCVPKPEETPTVPLHSPTESHPLLPSMVTTAAPSPAVPSTVTVVARATTTPTPAPNGTITIKNCPASRFSKASATPSASAMALKAVVIPGPFGKRRHICPMLGCKKIFPKLNKLREHICRHTGERPYACEECPATFVRMYDLRRHALIHLRKKNGLLSSVQ
ncbi:unnamed protein product [Schistocephalus solidus]|uniref:C2H2-type domain-containing protein n=1 Tax=Schistocephalus solidus TaxID=70667 RepID=A0A183SIX0_SCHSO|nr:unnamed protein product [Schistocephalus solidus]